MSVLGRYWLASNGSGLVPVSGVDSIKCFRERPGMFCSLASFVFLNNDCGSRFFCRTHVRRSVSPCVLLCLLLCHCIAVANDSNQPDRKAVEQLASDQQIEALLEPIRNKHGLPGLVAGVVVNDRLKVAGAVGLRKHGYPEKMTVNDQLHLGSNTKAMTATLLGLLVDRKKLEWDSTIGQVFSDVKSALHPEFRDVTLLQLLTHRAGVPANGPWWRLGNGSRVEQRQVLLTEILSSAPVHKPGTTTLYSNVGYVIAGHMAEQVTGKPWEELITADLFKPLKMQSTGFGIPGIKDQVDQPWGHRFADGKIEALQIDNDPALGPAGTVHSTLDDWSRFVALHLQGARGQAMLLMPETFDVLHRPTPGNEFACGWIVTERPWGKGVVLTHTGSNTTWYATVWIAPKLNAAFLAVTNLGGDRGHAACDEAIVQLIAFQKTMKE